MGFVGNYAPCGLPPQTGGMPVIPKNFRPLSAGGSLNIRNSFYLAELSAFTLSLWFLHMT